MSSSNTRQRLFAAVAAFVITIAQASGTDAFFGAIQTTTSSGASVNANIYSRGEEVFLNGGPQNNAAQGLPDGIYYFQVTDPSGAVLLSQDAAAARQLLVVDGRVAGVVPTEGAHQIGDYNEANGSQGVQLWPFAPTPNEGGEYKAWLIRQTPETIVDASDPRVLVFANSDAKTDNFKIRAPEVPLSLGALSPIVVCNDPKKDGAVVVFPAIQATGGQAPVSVSFSEASGTFFPIGTSTVVVTAIDATGKTASTTLTVTVKDCEGPRFASGETPVLTANLPADGCAAVVDYDQSLFSDPSGIQSVTFSPESGSSFQTGITSVAYVATDTLGNVSEGSFLVKVSDTTAPVIAPLSDLVVSTAPGQCSAIVNFAPVATDCSAVTLTASPAAGTAFAKGVTLVVVTAVDAHGNTASSTFSVTVKDTEPPTIVVPASIHVSTDPGKCSAVVSYGVSATDNCGPVELTVDGPAAGAAFPKGTTVITITAVDSSGNSSVATFSVTVTDNEPPTITAPASIVDALFTINGSFVDVGAPVVADNCGVAGVVGVRSDGASLTAPYTPGTTTITWTVTDTAGNTNQATQTVTIVGGSVAATRFYDANTNSLRDATELLLAGWNVVLTGTDSAGNPVGPVLGATTIDGSASFSGVPVGTYTVTIVKSAGGTWIETLPATQPVVITAAEPNGAVTFGAFAVGAANPAGGGGLTLGFWSNKNGEKTFSGSLAANLGALSALNLRNANGTAFNPTSYLAYRTWLLNGTATNMAYMLSVQLSAMYNNVSIRPNAFGGVDGSALIYAPGAANADRNGVLTVNALIVEADAALAANAVAVTSGPVRDYLQALKNALDSGNNNRSFVQAAPIPYSF